MTHRSTSKRLTAVTREFLGKARISLHLAPNSWGETNSVSEVAIYRLKSHEKWSIFIKWKFLRGLVIQANRFRTCRDRANRFRFVYFEVCHAYLYH